MANWWWEVEAQGAVAPETGMCCCVKGLFAHTKTHTNYILIQLLKDVLTFTQREAALFV